jgi:rRNA maturation protein Rpf1
VITVTTGRNPSQNTRKLVKELVKILPNARKLVRGKMPLKQLIDNMYDSDVTRLIMVYRGFNCPIQIEFMRRKETQLKSSNPTLIVRHVRYFPESKKGKRIKLQCLTITSKQDIKFAELLSDFLQIPIIKDDDKICEFSLNISRKENNDLILSIVNLKTRRIERFEIIIKELKL